jgi:hypothetical protein
VLRQIEDGLASEGIAIVGDPFREQSNEFFELAAVRFEMEIEESSVHFEEVRRPVRIARLRRR